MGSPNRPVLKQKRRYRYGNAFSFSYPAMFNLVLIYPTIIALSPCSFSHTRTCRFELMIDTSADASHGAQ